MTEGLASSPDDDEQETVTMPEGSRLFHATTAESAESVLRIGLEGFPGQACHMSTGDEWEFIAWYRCLGGDGLSALTTIEVDASGLELHWPGYDGKEHYYAFRTIEPSRLRVARQRTRGEVLAYLLTTYQDETLGLLTKSPKWLDGEL